MSIYFQTGSWFTQFNKSLIKALQQCKLDHVLQLNTCLILMSSSISDAKVKQTFHNSPERKCHSHTKKIYTIDVIV